jgi:hypothetical protein
MLCYRHYSLRRASNETVNKKTRLFTLRLWQAIQANDPDALEWRGKVQSLPDGEAYYFRDWPGLVRHLESMLAAASGVAGEDESQADSDLQS